MRENLKAARAAKGLTQQAMADKLGIMRGVTNEGEMENGKESHKGR